ncbi:MAG: hypothetical protein ISP91_07575 [Pseudomonadales bacterium]|nr:hypothetical protein [Pseudomonadales bacterium]
MTRLSDQEKNEFREDALSESRRADFKRLSEQTPRLTPTEHIEFLTWASGLSKEDPRSRKRPVERIMLL